MEQNRGSRARMLCTLFFTALRISAFTFGGGFVIISLMKKHFVDRLHWLTEEEMLDYTALAQTAPGPIAVNAAVLLGRHVAGTLGMAVAVIGTVIPPIVILTVVSLFYNAFAENRYVALFLRGMQAGVAAVILDVVTGLGINVLKAHSKVHDVLMILAFLAAFLFRIHAAWIILATLLLGVVLALLEKRRRDA